ncbi:hypothetical protein WH47_03747 [Habropoda laboriosa]|uniref:Uncharacterized protein n=1 Tax=Habropoda laboriosa TaxID=597456 RepID=A0A0L7QVV9_9HYME|nr:hypothetical protein WH47_03747 [Habropoda laboriosa]
MERECPGNEEANRGREQHASGNDGAVTFGRKKVEPLYTVTGVDPWLLASFRHFDGFFSSFLRPYKFMGTARAPWLRTELEDGRVEVARRTQDSSSDISASGLRASTVPSNRKAEREREREAGRGWAGKREAGWLVKPNKSGHPELRM